jgi:hypothetical protein
MWLFEIDRRSAWLCPIRPVTPEVAGSSPVAPVENILQIRIFCWPSGRRRSPASHRSPALLPHAKPAVGGTQKVLLTSMFCGGFSARRAIGSLGSSRADHTKGLRTTPPRGSKSARRVSYRRCSDLRCALIQGDASWRGPVCGNVTRELLRLRAAGTPASADA